MSIQIKKARVKLNYTNKIYYRISLLQEKEERCVAVEREREKGVGVGGGAKNIYIFH